MSEDTGNRTPTADVVGVEDASGAPSGLLARDEVEPEPPGRRPGSTGLLPLLRWTWRQLTSMRTALVLLFLLALAAIPGSILPQRPRNPSDVAGFYEQYPQLAPILDQLWLFNVFGAPWFAAIYLLLMISLVGCIVPRSARHVKALRARPPRAPRNLGRLPLSRQWETSAAPEDALSAVQGVLGDKRYRVDGTDTSVAAEKGYLRETGNLFFHISLLALLFAVAAGELFGYHGKVLVVEGEAFANTKTSYASYSAGSFVGPTDMLPFTLHLNEFTASYIRGGQHRGQPESFSADVRYRPSPEAPQQRQTIGVNHPLVMGSTKVYLLGHGYAPTFRVRDGQGNIAFEGAVPFLPRNTSNFTSDGVVKAPDAQPKQLAFAGFFTPTTMPDRGPISVFPAAVNPSVTLLAYKGRLAVSTGASQSVYELDTAGLTRIKSQQLAPGETMTLPHGLGSITFTGFKEWAGLRVTEEPAKMWVLASAVVILLGLLLTLGVRRRRVWARARRTEDGRTVVDVGGLTRDTGRGFEDEFDALVTRMRSRSGGPPDSATDSARTHD